MQYERHITDLRFDCFKNVELKSCPSFGIYAVDVADACCQHCDAQISDLLALIRICAFARAYNTVFFAADRADFRFQGKALLSANLSQFCGLCQVLFDRKVRTVKHDGGESCLDALVSAVI